MPTRITVLLTAFLAAGCSAPMTGRSDVAPSLNAPVGRDAAIATLPASAGFVINVAERRYSNGVVQEITLKGDPTTHGENRLTVAVRRPAGLDGSGTNPLKIDRPDARSIRAEIAERFPGIQMTVSTVVERNAYGTFGYAGGRGPSGDSCLYAWQFIDDMPAVAEGSRLAFLSPSSPMSLRLRICRANHGEQELVEMMRRIVLYGSDQSRYSQNYQ